MTTAKRILVVGDDRLLRQSLAEQLSLQPDLEAVEMTEAAIPTSFDTGAAVAAVLAVAQTGQEAALCRRLRAAGTVVPVLALAAAGTDRTALMATACGASDVVLKPVRLATMLLRLRAHIRLYEEALSIPLAVGVYEFRPAAKLLIDSRERAKRIRLTEKETAILRHLHAAAGHVVSREELLSDVCGYTASATTHTLETHIYRLRRKIERDPARAEILLTENGGYRLVP